MERHELKIDQGNKGYPGGKLIFSAAEQVEGRKNGNATE
jgi:hypothetical protein